MAKSKATGGGSAFTENVRAVAVININPNVAFGTRAEQEDDAYSECDSNITKLEIQGSYLIGEATCGNEACVCHVKFLPELIAILQRIVDAK
jgi:hypothetical protein